MDANYSIFIGICFLNPTLTNVGMGLQKHAINCIPATDNRARKSAYVMLWTLGLFFQGIVVVLAAKAVSIGNASTLGGFAGFGLISLAVFSRLVLKEVISKREFFGMFTILVGTAMLGFFSNGHQKGLINFEQRRMIIFLICYAVVAAALVVFMLRDIKVYGGAILGVIGGGMSGLALVLLKIIVGHFAGKGFAAGLIIEVLKNPYSWLTAIGGVGGLTLVQIGYKYGKSIQVVPGFSSMVVIMPALSGYLVLREAVPLICAVSLAVITAGVLITTTAAHVGAKNGKQSIVS